MDKKESPKTTGVSDLTGKVLKVRHATEADMAFIEETMKRHQFDAENLDCQDFVVATENSEIVGLGSLRKTGGIYEVGCLVVLEEKKEQGIGQLIARHLVDHAPVNKIYAMTDRVDYFKKMGFVEIKDKSKEYLATLDLVCNAGKKTKKVLMSHEKTGK